jgi:hypothetical protein
MMMMSLNIATTGLNAGNPVNVKPRQTAIVPAEKQTTAKISSTPRQTMALSEDTLVQQALTRTQPTEKIDSEALNYHAPLVDYICNPEALTQKSLKTGVGIGTIFGIFGSGGVLAFMASRENANLEFMKTAGILFAGAVGGGLLGALTGWIIGKDKAENQEWVNKNMFQMMNLTSSNATIGQGNKALKHETGDSFTQRLSRRENRQRDELMIAAMM